MPPESTRAELVSQSRILRKPKVRTTFQLAADIYSGGQPIRDTLHQAIRVVLNWLDRKCSRSLPSQAWRGESFEMGGMDEWSESVRCVATPDVEHWAVRYTHLDASVAGRTWTSDVAFRRRTDGIGIGIRVHCASLPHVQEAIAYSRPWLVVDLAKKFGLHEARVFNGKPWLLRNEEDLRRLHELLLNPRRTCPVVLLTQLDYSSGYILDPFRLGLKTQGFGHIVQMPFELGFKWTELVGKPWSAFLGAVRTYNPGLKFDSDSPIEHPKALPERISEWRGDQLHGVEAFAQFLVERMAFHAATKKLDWGDCLFITDIRAKIAEVESQRIQDTRISDKRYEDEVAVLQEEVQALKEKYTEKDRETEESFALAEEYERQYNLVHAENRSLRLQNDALRMALEAKTGESADALAPIPTGYEDMQEWVDKNLSGRLVLLPRAARAAEKAQFQDVKFAYECLLLLANEYRNMRLGRAGKDEFEQRLASMGLRYGPAISESRAGEQGDEYRVNYPVGTNQVRQLKLHLRSKGSTRDPLRCLAVYFFWDEDTEQVVVGSLPGHLEIRSS